jgi:hypothetical protein
MEDIDAIRGFQRNILFNTTGYSTSAGVPVTNCVVEVVENDWQGSIPMLSMRFYNRPFHPRKLAEEMAEHGNPAYDEATPIGIELNLSPDLAQSLIEQINGKWPELLRALQTTDEG